jgi:AcrR family transcriptional regulator
MTEQDVAAAALVIVDRDGLATLSMRTVAEELGMATMSLYRYVTDREHIEQLVVDVVLSAIDTTLPGRLGWRSRVTTLVLRARDAAVAHPAALPLLLVHRAQSVHSTRWGEALLFALTDAGFDGAARAIAFRTLLSYLFGALQVAHYGPLSGEGTRKLTQLSAELYPLLAETAKAAQRIDAESEFKLGLALVLSGVAAELEQP